MFEHVGLLYRARFMNPNWERRNLADARQALELFLRGYAFERVGATSSYAHAAEATIRTLPILAGSAAWKNYQLELPDEKLNNTHNPLFHTARNCQCAICVLESRHGLRNIVAEAQDYLVRDMVRDGIAAVSKIRGSGNKISAFFLRDVALFYGIAPLHDRALLQPIDRWVRRTVRLLDTNVGKTDRAVQDWMADTFAAPELANAGIWYFGAQAAESPYQYRHALADPRFAKSLVERHVQQLAAVVAAW